MDDESFYEAVVQELEQLGPRKGLWAKAFASASGNESSAKALYLEWRANQLKEEHQRLQEVERQAKEREALEREVREREQQASAEARRRLRPFAVRLRALGLPVETVALQLESKGLANVEATRLAQEVFGSGDGI
jgi:hypothetical protein